MNAELTGQSFGRLMVIGPAWPEGSTRRLWLCRCECGTEAALPTGSLRSGRARSCGCWRREQLSIVATRHGFLKDRVEHPLYRTWTAMRRRCTDPKAHNYRHYGGRGVAVCAEWRDFGAFVASVGERPSANHTLDRIDNNGNYEPANVRWATRVEQRANRRDARKEYPS